MLQWLYKQIVLAWEQKKISNFCDKFWKKKIILHLELKLDSNMYFLDPKKYKIVRKIPLPSIKQIVISEKSAILLGIKVRNEYIKINLHRLLELF